MTHAAEHLDPRAFIRDRLPVVPVPDVPEISLHRAQPSSGLWRLAASGQGRSGSPYWAYPWPGGQVLARYILDHPQQIAGRRCLDLGSGSGLVAIAAAKAGACEVIAAETDPSAAVALQLNCEANGVMLTIVTDNLIAGPPPPVDLALAGDLFYAQDLAERVTAFLRSCVAAGSDVLIGDIGRAYLPKAHLRPVADYMVHDFGDGDSRPKQPGFVFAFV